jgi:hypothetical protein
MRGPTKVEILTLVGILVVLAALVVELRPICGPFPPHGPGCVCNVRNIVGLLEFGSKYPKKSGLNLVLYLVEKGDLQGEDRLDLLFCPGDKKESLEKAGGAEAYRNLDLTVHGKYGHLTSYAFRSPLEEADAAREQGRPLVLVCDDSEDHHGGRGFVVGLTGGAAKWRDKVDDWGLDRSTHVEVGKNSVVEELRCLRSE